MEKDSNIVVMGGSFNPPTIAHKIIFQAALDGLDAEAGYLVPVSHAYLKRKMCKAGCSHMCLSEEQRLEMLKAMTRDDPRIHIDTREYGQVMASTYDTMSCVQELYPDSRIWFVLGDDKLRLLSLLQWRRGFLDRFGAVIFARGKLRTLPKDIASHEDAVRILPTPEGIEGISSTAVREHLFAPDAVAEMLHPAVLEQLRSLRKEDFPEEITEFAGDYAFLDDDWAAPVEYEGTLYACVTNAWLASRYPAGPARTYFTGCTPEKARRRAGRVPPDPALLEARWTILEQLERYKFTRSPELRAWLLNTGNKRLLAGTKKRKEEELQRGVSLSSWKGENRCGIVLMRLREELRKETE